MKDALSLGPVLVELMLVYWNHYKVSIAGWDNRRTYVYFWAWILLRSNFGGRSIQRDALGTVFTLLPKSNKGEGAQLLWTPLKGGLQRALRCSSIASAPMCGGGEGGASYSH